MAAILLSFLFKKDADIMIYEETIGAMENSKESLRPANLGTVKPVLFSLLLSFCYFYVKIPLLFCNLL